MALGRSCCVLWGAGYATFAELAGAEGSEDPEAAAAGLPPIDSVSIASLLLSQEQTLRTKGLLIETHEGCAVGSAVGSAASSEVEGLAEALAAVAVPSDVSTEAAAKVAAELAGRAQIAGRSELHLSSRALIARTDGGLYKLLLGWQTCSGWVGPTYPAVRSG